MLNPYNRMDVCYRHDGFVVRVPKRWRGGDMTDAAACRKHMMRLKAGGMWWTQIGKRCGVSEGTVRRVANGTQQFIRTSTAAALLSVELPR